jgi:type II secretory pathway component PulJ
VELLIALAIVCLVAAFVTVPLRSRAGAEGVSDPVEDEIAELEARKETLYREIRDAEADRESGKLPQADFERLDGELRREAVGVLKRLDRLRERTGESPAGD